MAFEYAIALTGGIATGKSTVASLLGLNGLRIIDADTIAHRILDENGAWVVERFGDEFVKNGKVDRSALGKIIFADPEAKKELETFLHPKIRTAIEEQSEKQDKLKYPYLIDIPLFFETSSYPIKNSVVVYTPKALQLERFMKRNGFSQEESLRRIESQMDIDEKKARATWVIDNSSNLKHLQRECEQFVDTIKLLYPAPKV
ncbi:MAG: dephospho-CoA kinase [Sulfuricurvum sp. GWF2_44_89]|jgi:dephospho-CoA kinase|uniref:Dephospho-CoA kinase n=1 Tax=Sulfuricurvum kujiense TaxID=148813 RepID=A0A2D3WQ71_9BACT|nr:MULTISPECIES: dephospho-CoA kinase [Sulfuricurvum]OHD77435.1 MAG: dephospho-CoA kinase [Sulfuricurvum sp. GWF2_44_89]OHD91206.1 MAG: dephospho-CoA kinase [Sulfuricurvum sp. RIFOXYD2_FULL_44_160]OHD93214.1 MAG: dephospho-CoA kinase [Sulfuricurvum sp. RIFOXYD12_FULL_44_77]DAB39409.1 MAG TPA: dephospho-CoA kinase [Sulfuricurvum kujiense]